MFRLIVLTVALQACLVGPIGSGEAITQDRDVPAEVVSVSLETTVRTTVVAGSPSNALRVTCDDNLVDDITTDVEDGVLRVRTDRVVAIHPRVDCLVEVRLVTLEHASGSGSGELALSGALDGLLSISNAGTGSMSVGAFRTCDLDIEVSGTGPVDLEHVEACDVTVQIGGTGRVTVQGRADSLLAGISGTGGLRGADLEVEAADVQISGTGGMELTVHQALRARLSGTGGATIFGDPQVRDVQESGTGRVRFEGDR